MRADCKQVRGVIVRECANKCTAGKLRQVRGVILRECTNECESGELSTMGTSSFDIVLLHCCYVELISSTKLCFDNNYYFNQKLFSGYVLQIDILL